MRAQVIAELVALLAGCVGVAIGAQFDRVANSRGWRGWQMEYSEDE